MAIDVSRVGPQGPARGERVGVVPGRLDRGRPDALPERDGDVRARLVAAQEAERARISRELHDVVGQALLAVRLNLLALERVDARTGASGAAILDSITAVDAALREVRTAAFDLRPALLDDLGLAAALGALCRALAGRAGVAIACRVDIDGQRLPTEIETTCFRVVQEALTNAIRHAKARRVSVALELHPATGLLVLEVSDDGVGFDPAGFQGMAAIGIAGMTERAALVGGHVSVRSGRESGTVVVGRFRVDRAGCAAR